MNNVVVSTRVLALGWSALVEWRSGLRAPVYGEAADPEFRPKVLHCLIV